MAESAFNSKEMIQNPFQDPMGDDAHQGLERFLEKFHQPGVPSHTIITDPEFYVFLWFHNAMGELIKCPYTDSDDYYSPRLGGVDFWGANNRFSRTWMDENGIQSGTSDTTLQKYCVDLTPFVTEATLPEIAPANGTKIKTLFGETTAGTFSPYASDGSRQITLQIIDTEYSILDAIFYPWMKDINSPWWYKPENAFDEWATPYPMATLEIQRPRMRYKNYPQKGESRNLDDYTYYSYRFLGVKPTTYSAFSPNQAGVSNLTRSLTFICDMCLVDLTSDAHITNSSSTNLGNRRSFIFSSSDSSSDSSDSESSTNKSSDSKDQEDYDNAENDLEEQEVSHKQNQEDIDQQSNGDMAGQDESDDVDPEFKAGQMQDCDEQDDGSGYSEPSEGSSDNANEAAEQEDYAAEEQAIQEGSEGQNQEEKSFFDKVCDTMSDVGSSVMDGAKTAAGWVADGVSAGVGLAADATKSAVGVAASIGNSAINAVGNVASSTLGAVSGIAQGATGAAGSLVSTALGAASSLGSSLVGTATNLAGSALGATSTLASSALGSASSLGSSVLGGLSSMLGGSSSSGNSSSSSSGVFGALSSALKGASSLGNTAFGVVSNIASNALGATSGVAKSATSATSTLLGGVLGNGLSTAFSAIGNTVSTAGNLLGGATNKLASIASGTASNATQTATGVTNQTLAATNQTREASSTISALNLASNGISSTIGTVGNLATSIINTAGSTGGKAIGALGTTVTRMLNSSGNKPTPVESYVGMVTKTNTKSASMA